MMDHEYTIQKTTTTTTNNNSTTTTNDLAMELPSLSAGTIADLCIVTREHKGEDDNTVGYEEPLKPYELPVNARQPHIEPGRVDIRLMALYEKLARLGNAATPDGVTPDKNPSTEMNSVYGRFS